MEQFSFQRRGLFCLDWHVLTVEIVSFRTSCCCCSSSSSCCCCCCCKTGLKSQGTVIPQEKGSQSSCLVTNLHRIFLHLYEIFRISIYPSKSVRPCRNSWLTSQQTVVGWGRSRTDTVASPYCCPTPPVSPKACRDGPVATTLACNCDQNQVFFWTRLGVKTWLKLRS